MKPLVINRRAFGWKKPIYVYDRLMRIADGKEYVTGMISKFF